MRLDRERAYELLAKFEDFSYPKAIWLDKVTCAAINEILSQFYEVAEERSEIVRSPEPSDLDPIRGERPQHCTCFGSRGSPFESGRPDSWKTLPRFGSGAYVLFGSPTGVRAAPSPSRSHISDLVGGPQHFLAGCCGAAPRRGGRAIREG